MKNDNVTPGRPFPYGAEAIEDGVQFSIPFSESSKVVLKVYDKAGKTIYSIPMNDYHVLGSVHSVIIHGLKPDDISYNFVIDGETVHDPYVTRLRSKYRWGDFKRSAKGESCLVYDHSYNWEGDEPLKLPYNEVIGYMLHVRGFTKHISSQVKGRGTFLGIIEKVPYLKELGITQVELMPAYDFEECETIQSFRSSMTDEEGNSTGSLLRLNYWGFKAGSYFVPKPQYTFSDDSTVEFKDMVKALHRAGIEVVMQFYFPLEVNRNLISDCLRFWQGEYHIDGFHIFGSHLPLDVLATDPLLTDTKLYYERYDADAIFSTAGCGNNGFLAEFNQDYTVDVRRFLKSDEDMLHKYLFRSRCNPDRIKVINHLTSFDGFTLNDMVSYDYKHNEANGEDNKDGTGYNYSWNCGTEGFTRKNAILKLRMKQLKNAFCLLLLSQGTPMFMAGDEFMNSQGGNNNPYCQDNDITWLNWKRNRRADELFEYVKALIALRKEHPILHMEREATLLDHKSCGYPDVSYHSEMAWYPQMDTHIRYIGTMLCGMYAGNGREDDFFYIATNMHWEDHTFALPKLPKDMAWKYCMDTAGAAGDSYPVELDDNGNKLVRVPSRTIVVMVSTKIAAKKKYTGKKKGEGR
ncbi:MAG: hypothetical protein K6E63_03920 [Lachnospiraceae bacterium]|nr:hypothetical protein [Lachnospiraceae bacterium]